MCLIHPSIRLNNVQNSISVSHETHCAPIANTALMLFEEILAIYTNSHAKRVNTFFGKAKNTVISKRVVHMDTLTVIVTNMPNTGRSYLNDNTVLE
jgi:hypothetical protein